MSVTVLIPATLRKEVEERETVPATGTSVGEALEDLCQRYPGLGTRLFTTEGRLNRFVNVFLNDEDIRFLDDLKTPLSEGDEVLLLPALAGG